MFKRVVVWVIALTVFGCLPALGSGQLVKDYKLASVTASAGEDPFASGITGLIRLQNSTTFAEVAVQHEQAWFIYGLLGGNDYVGEYWNAGMSLGHFQGAPYAGPYLVYGRKVAEFAGVPVGFGAVLWHCYFAWEPDNWKTKNDGMENPELVLGGYFQGVNMSFGDCVEGTCVNLTHSWSNFLDDKWNRLPGVVLNFPLADGFRSQFSVTLNDNTGRRMLSVGTTWVPGG